MAEFFPWDQAVYSVGVAVLDEQHKKLFGLINALFEAMKIGKGSLVIGKILTELTEYTKFHFSDEEGYMTKCNYPELATHKQIHAKLTSEVVAIQTKFASDQNINLSIETLDFLKSWLINHIQGTDKKYSSYMNKIIK